MQKTTVYLPDDLKQALVHIAVETGISEAQLIRDGVRLAIQQHTAPLPKFGIFDGPSDMSERVEVLLKGFGES